MKPLKSRLNLGCGHDPRPDYHNVDIDERTGCDEIVDLESFPWPWPDNSFEEIRAWHSLEHLGESVKVFFKILQEMYRVSKPGATWQLTLPHWRDDDFFNDPTHVRVITPRMMTLFDQAKNLDDIRNRAANTRHGLDLKIDLEVLHSQMDLREPWKGLQERNEISPEQLRHVYETQHNVCYQLHILIRVHKPQRGYLT